MTVNKKVTVREVAHRTGLTYKQSEQAVSALIELWTDALVSGEKIAINNFLILEVREIRRPEGQTGQLQQNGEMVPAPTAHRRVLVRPGTALRTRLHNAVSKGNE